MPNILGKKARVHMFWRNASGIIKFVVYTATFVVLYIILFICLLKISEFVSESCCLKTLVDVNISSGSDISAYVIAAATLEFAILTILQQHFSRQQDRVLDFPDMCIKNCMIFIKQEKIMAEYFGRGYVDGKFLIQMFFDKSFPVYYTPTINKAWVCQRTYMAGDDKLYKMKVYSSYFDKIPENAKWGIQIDFQPCILETVKRTQMERVQYLEFIYDVSWENQLLPLVNRIFSKLYMRMIISLEDVGTRDKDGCCFKVRGLRIEKASMCAPSV